MFGEHLEADESGCLSESAIGCHDSLRLPGHRGGNVDGVQGAEHHRAGGVKSEIPEPFGRSGNLGAQADRQIFRLCRSDTNRR